MNESGTIFRRFFFSVQNHHGQFTLLVSCKNQATKALLYNGWQLVESAIQFTGGALGKGVSSLRTYRMKNDTLIVVANMNMLAEETNLYVPLYTVEHSDVDTLGIGTDKIGSCNETLTKMQAHNSEELFDKLTVCLKEYDLKN